MQDKSSWPTYPLSLFPREKSSKIFIRASSYFYVIQNRWRTQQKYSKASKARSVGSTNLNRASSRSHAILTVEMNIVDEERQKSL